MEKTGPATHDDTTAPHETMAELLRAQYESGDVAFSEAIWQAALDLLMQGSRLN